LLGYPSTKDPMNFPISSWVVFIYNQDLGTFSPAFPDLDSAEHFANSMRLACDALAVSEPVPVTPTQQMGLKVLT
jgi:hypothetical protein